MALEEYRRKRTFTKTREPRGKKGGTGRERIFVVQHHMASHEHHDFRLELDGVLKSWAVPKLVSTDPAIRRLAVQVEDHPLGYAKFKGRIPKGQYGAGTVDIFDRGTWEPLGDPHTGIDNGKLLFKLNGHRLKGEWVLVRTSGADDAKPQWLLFKRRERLP